MAPTMMSASASTSSRMRVAASSTSKSVISGPPEIETRTPFAPNIEASSRRADVLVVGSPTYKGSYTGLFKHFFDLIDPAALRGKPVVLLATGGGERHALIVEHQLRPLFGFFEALALPTAVYATDKDFADGVLVSEAIRKRAAQAVDEVGFALSRSAARQRLAAE